MIVAPIRERSGGGGGRAGSGGGEGREVGGEGAGSGGEGGSDEKMLYSRDKNFSVFQENRNNFHPHANLANYFYFPKLNPG